MIGGFRSDLSITRKTDGNIGNITAGVCFPKSRINENGGNAATEPPFCSLNARRASVFCVSPQGIHISLVIFVRGYTYMYHGGYVSRFFIYGNCYVLYVVQEGKQCVQKNRAFCFCHPSPNCIRSCKFDVAPSSNCIKASKVIPLK